MRFVLDKYCVIRDGSGKIIARRKVSRSNTIKKMKSLFINEGVLDEKEQEKQRAKAKSKV